MTSTINPHLPLLQNNVSQTRISTPDLTASPASSTSSISLPSDERSIPSSRSSTCADLNPDAEPFVPGSFIKPLVPGFCLMHNPILSKDQLDTADSLPDFKLAPLSDWDTFSEEPPELLENELHSPSTPAYPPGLRLPPTCLLQDLPPPALPPSYLPLIAHSLRPGLQDHVIESYSRVIITSRPRWDFEGLLELAVRICFEMYNPCTNPLDKNGRVTKACDPARYMTYTSNDPTCLNFNAFFVEYERRAQRQHAITILVKHLDQHLSTIHSREAAQMFMCSLRELVLTRFLETWDMDNVHGRAMSLLQPATPYDVRCALTLCKSIASLYDQNLIERPHIIMCINILLKSLMSIEHVEALALLILGCGPTFWDLSNFTATTLGIGTYASGPQVPPKSTADLVQIFLDALLASVTKFSLHDSASLVFPSEVWGEGQLKIRLRQIEVALRKWAVLLSRSSQLGNPMDDR